MRKKLTIIILILFVIVLALGIWVLQRNVYSREIVRLEILGPSEAELASEVEYVVRYKNNGNIRLESPVLIFEFPKNAEVINDPSGNGNGRLRKEKELADINPGEENKVSFKGRLFGKENEAITAKVWLKYRPKNLTAYYESATTFTTTIKRKVCLD